LRLADILDVVIFLVSSSTGFYKAFVVMSAIVFSVTGVLFGTDPHKGRPFGRP